MKTNILRKRVTTVLFVTAVTLLTTLTTIFVIANDGKQGVENVPVMKQKQIDIPPPSITKSVHENVTEPPSILIPPPILPASVVYVTTYKYTPEYTSKPEAEKFQPTKFIQVLSQPVYGARCHFKSWMDWRSITSRSSRQWRMQQIAYTCELGFRRVNGLYMIALGTYFLYGGVGDVFEITLSGGRTFRAVVGDVKSDRHTDPTNRFHLSDGSLVEFIVDREVMCRYVLRTRGDVSFAGFPGYVVSIYRIPELFIAV